MRAEGSEQSSTSPPSRKPQTSQGPESNRGGVGVSHFCKRTGYKNVVGLDPKQEKHFNPLFTISSWDKGQLSPLRRRPQLSISKQATSLAPPKKRSPSLFPKPSTSSISPHISHPNLTCTCRKWAGSRDERGNYIPHSCIEGLRCHCLIQDGGILHHHHCPSSPAGLPPFLQ